MHSSDGHTFLVMRSTLRLPCAGPLASYDKQWWHFKNLILTSSAKGHHRHATDRVCRPLLELLRQTIKLIAIDLTIEILVQILQQSERQLTGLSVQMLLQLLQIEETVAILVQLCKQILFPARSA